MYLTGKKVLSSSLFKKVLDKLVTQHAKDLEKKSRLILTSNVIR